MKTRTQIFKKIILYFFVGASLVAFFSVVYKGENNTQPLIAELSYTLSEDETEYYVKGIDSTWLANNTVMGIKADVTVIVPDTYLLLPVTAISSNAFSMALSFRASIVILDLSGASNLKAIESYAFTTTKVNEIVFGANSKIEEIGDLAFSFSSIEKMDIHNLVNLKTLGERVFSDLGEGTSVKYLDLSLLKNLNTIGDVAVLFTTLEVVKIGYIENIGERIFSSDIPSLELIVVDNKETYLKYIDEEHSMHVYKDIMTYETSIIYESGKSYSSRISQRKLFDRSIKYTKDDITIWKINQEYEFPNAKFVNRYQLDF